MPFCRLHVARDHDCGNDRFARGAGAGAALACGPFVLSASDLDRVTAGSHVGPSFDIDIVHEVDQPFGTLLIHVRLDEEQHTLEGLTSVRVETAGTVDRHDNIWIIQRARTLTDDKARR